VSHSAGEVGWGWDDTLELVLSCYRKPGTTRLDTLYSSLYIIIRLGLVFNDYFAFAEVKLIDIKINSLRLRVRVTTTTGYHIWLSCITVPCDTVWFRNSTRLFVMQPIRATNIYFGVDLVPEDYSSQCIVYDQKGKAGVPFQVLTSGQSLYPS
jgi:hypothetical protein